MLEVKKIAFRLFKPKDHAKEGGSLRTESCIPETSIAGTIPFVSMLGSTNTDREAPPSPSIGSAFFVPKTMAGFYLGRKLGERVKARGEEEIADWAPLGLRQSACSERPRRGSWQWYAIIGTAQRQNERRKQ